MLHKGHPGKCVGTMLSCPIYTDNFYNQSKCACEESGARGSAPRTKAGRPPVTLPRVSTADETLRAKARRFQPTNSTFCDNFEGKSHHLSPAHVFFLLFFFSMNQNGAFNRFCTHAHVEKQNTTKTRKNGPGRTFVFARHRIIEASNPTPVRESTLASRRHRRRRRPTR